MPNSDAVELARESLAYLPELRILIISECEDAELLRRLDSVAIHGYLLKNEASESLLQAVRAIEEGEFWFSHSIVFKLREIRRIPQTEMLLTAREREVLHHIGSGYDPGSIAVSLCLAEQTVRNYAAVIYQKIGVKSRVQAVVWAQQKGFVMAEDASLHSRAAVGQVH